MSEIRTIQPREDGCRVYFHPTTLRVLRAIEAHIDEAYSCTWGVIAREAQVSMTTLYRHLDALESVEYISRSVIGNKREFGGTEIQVDYGDPDA